jgi:hypothetical protein
MNVLDHLRLRLSRFLKYNEDYPESKSPRPITDPFADWLNLTLVQALSDVRWISWRPKLGYITVAIMRHFKRAILRFGFPSDRRQWVTARAFKPGAEYKLPEE